MLFLRKVLILFKVEKHLSASAVVMGVVMRIFRRVTVSKKTSSRLFSINSCSRSTAPRQVLAVDETKLGLQLTPTERWIGLQSPAQSIFRKHHCVLFKPVCLQQGGTNKVVCEGEPFHSVFEYALKKIFWLVTVLKNLNVLTDVKSWDVSGVSHVLKGQQFMTFIVFLLFSFLMTGRYCFCIVHPKHPLHSYHGFVFCFVY